MIKMCSVAILGPSPACGSRRKRALDYGWLVSDEFVCRVPQHGVAGQTQIFVEMNMVDG